MARKNKKILTKNASAKKETAFIVNSPDDITCTICADYFDKPVTLPCHHRICKCCLENICTLSNIECPLCRKRLNTWVRTNKISSNGAEKFIDLNFEKTVAEYKIFYENLEKAADSGTAGSSSGIGSSGVTSLGSIAQSFSFFGKLISKPGEIGAEYKTEQDKISSRMKKLDDQSVDYIQGLLKDETDIKTEEEKRLEEQQLKDEELAKQLHYELNENSQVGQLESHVFAGDHNFSFQPPNVPRGRRSLGVLTRSSSKQTIIKNKQHKLTRNSCSFPLGAYQANSDNNLETITSTPLKLTKSSSVKRKLHLLATSPEPEKSVSDKENLPPDSLKVKLDLDVSLTFSGCRITDPGFENLGGNKTCKEMPEQH